MLLRFVRWIWNNIQGLIIRADYYSLLRRDPSVYLTQLPMNHDGAQSLR